MENLSQRQIVTLFITYLLEKYYILSAQNT
jgi:hypothetical protein